MVSDFESNDKITEIEFLMDYNPKVINRKIKAMKSQIDSLYQLNMSHVITNEKDMMVFVSLMRKRNFNIIQKQHTTG